MMIDTYTIIYVYVHIVPYTLDSNDITMVTMRTGPYTTLTFDVRIIIIVCYNVVATDMVAFILSAYTGTDP